VGLTEDEGGVAADGKLGAKLLLDGAVNLADLGVVDVSVNLPPRKWNPPKSGNPAILPSYPPPPCHGNESRNNWPMHRERGRCPQNTWASCSSCKMPWTSTSLPDRKVESRLKTSSALQ